MADTAYMYTSFSGIYVSFPGSYKTGSYIPFYDPDKNSLGELHVGCGSENIHINGNILSGNWIPGTDLNNNLVVSGHVTGLLAQEKAVVKFIRNYTSAYFEDINSNKLFKITKTSATSISVSKGFVNYNGLMYVTPNPLTLNLNGGTAALLSSGYICLTAQWSSDTVLNYSLINIPSGSLNTSGIRNINQGPMFPLGFITVTSGTITKIENYYPNVAIIIEAAVCADDSE